MCKTLAVRWRLPCFSQFDSGQFLPVSDENFIRNSPPQIQLAAHNRVSAFTLVTANSLEDSWHVCVFTWPPLFRNPSCASSDAHLPQALSPQPPSLHPPLPHSLWTPAVSSLWAACLPQDKASSQTWQCWPPAGSRAGAGGRFPGWRGSDKSHPPAAAWDPRPLPIEGWEWPELWQTTGLTGRPTALRPHFPHGYRLKAVSPEQTGGGRQGQSDVRQERWSWKRDGGEQMRCGGVTEKLSEKMYCPQAPRTTSPAQTLIASYTSHHSKWHFMHLHPIHPSNTSETIHLTISPSLRSVHWHSAPPIISLSVR